MFTIDAIFISRTEVEEDIPDPGVIGMERRQKQLEAEATARRLAKEAEMELAAELAQKLFIQGEELAQRHHQEIEYLAAQQTAATQKLSPEGQEAVKSMLKAQTSVMQGAIPKQPIQGAASVATQGGAEGGSSTNTIFKQLDQ